MPHGKTLSAGGGRFGATTCAARMVFSYINDSRINSSNSTRAADAVAPNVADPPEERRPTTDIKPLARSKCRRRRRGAPPCRRHARGVPLNRLWFGPTAPPSISDWVDIWRIDGLLTHKLYRNGGM